MHTTTLRKLGGSICWLCRRLFSGCSNCRPGARVRIAVENGGLVVEPCPRPRYTLTQLLAAPDYSEPMSPEEREWVDAPTARWSDPAALKRMFGSADILRDGRVVFDIGGNKCRLVAWVNYHYGVVYVRFIGTHREYDKIDAQTV